MAALFQPDESGDPRPAQFEAMTPAWLPAVARIEQAAYALPWSQGNFSDSLLAGYEAQVLTGGARAPRELLGYFVAMKGVDEVHLLNITVAPVHQGQGWAPLLLDALSLWSRGQRAQWLWLEVRVSNLRAQAVYERYGFRQVGLRRGYYPTRAPDSAQPNQVDASGPREDARVMSFPL
jgi:[ribosomal protein S18]-alanine N-acetyltransferase